MIVSNYPGTMERREELIWRIIADFMCDVY